MQNTGSTLTPQPLKSKGTFCWYNEHPTTLRAPIAIPLTPSHHGDSRLKERNNENVQVRGKLTSINLKPDCKGHSHSSRGTRPCVTVLYLVPTKCSHTVRAAVCWWDVDLTLHVQKIFSLVSLPVAWFVCTNTEKQQENAAVLHGRVGDWPKLIIKPHP